MGTVPEIEHVINSNPGMVCLGHPTGGEGEETHLVLLLTSGLIT